MMTTITSLKRELTQIAFLQRRTMVILIEPIKKDCLRALRRKPRDFNMIQKVMMMRTKQ